MKNNIKRFLFMLIIVLGILYIIEIIAWPFCIWAGWDKFKWWNLLKFGIYLLITAAVYIQDYLGRKKVKENGLSKL